MSIDACPDTTYPKPVITGVTRVPGSTTELDVTFTYPHVVDLDNWGSGMPTTRWALGWSKGSDGQFTDAFVAPNTGRDLVIRTNSIPWEEGVQIIVTPNIGISCKGPSSDPYSLHPTPPPPPGKRLTLYWRDDGTLFKAAPDDAPDKLFQQPQQVGADGEFSWVRAAARVRTDDEMVLYVIDDSGDLWATREDVPTRGEGSVKVGAGWGSYIRLTTFGALTRSGNEDLIALSYGEKYGVQIAHVYTNNGFARLSTPKTLPFESEWGGFFGRGDYTGNGAPDVFTCSWSTVTRKSSTLLHEGRWEDDQLVWAPPVDLGVIPLPTPSDGYGLDEGFSLGDSTGDGKPDVISVLHQNAFATVGVLPGTGDNTRPLADWKSAFVTGAFILSTMY